MQKRMIMMAKAATVAVVFALGAMTTAREAKAQEVPKSALADLVKKLAEKSGTPKKAEASSATRFKPTGKPLMLDTIVSTLGQSEEQRAALRQVLTQGMTAVEDALKKEGRANDVSAALTLFIATQWSAATGKEVADASSDALLAQTDALLAAPEMNKVSDADKQRFYEYCTYMSVFTSMSEGTATDDAGKKAVRGVAAQIFKTLLPIDPAKVSIGTGGLAFPSGTAPANVPASASAAVLSARSPAGWEKKTEQGGVAYTRSVSTDRGGLSVTILVLNAGAAKGNPETVADSLFDKIIRPRVPAPGLPNDIRPEAFRRYVGNDLRCTFLGISRNIKQDSLDYLGTTQEMQLYAVESGGMVVPIMVLFSGHEGNGSDGKLVKSGVRGEWLEDFLKGLSGTPSGKPLFSNAELAGDYQMSAATTGLQYYNVNTGASAGYAYVVHGSKLSLHADGTFEVMDYGANGIGGPANFQIQKGKGRYTIVKDGANSLLKMTDAATGKSFNQRLAGAIVLPGDAGKLLITVPIGIPVNATNVALSASRYRTKPPQK